MISKKQIATMLMLGLIVLTTGSTMQIAIFSPQLNYCPLHSIEPNFQNMNGQIENVTYLENTNKAKKI